jgi:hypothetical protein
MLEQEMQNADDRKYPVMLVTNVSLRVSSILTAKAVQPMILYGDTVGAYPHSLHSVVSFQLAVRHTTEWISLLS